MDVSLYVHGLISFGALTGAMIATSGDEAFVMLAKFPGTALLLFALLYGISIPFAWVADRVVKGTGYVPCESCKLNEYHAEEEIHHLTWRSLRESFAKVSFARHIMLLAFGFFAVAIFLGIGGPQSWGWERVTLLILLFLALGTVLAVSDHYLKEHIWSHMVKAHVWRVFLWTFFALLVVHIGLKYWDFRDLISNNMAWMFLLGALVAVTPESGPHLIFVMLFGEDVIPFSVLFTSSFVQDGHGMLPLLSYTVKDSVVIKILNLTFGLGVGVLLYIAGW